jgi:hypothetical protein
MLHNLRNWKYIKNNFLKREKNSAYWIKVSSITIGLIITLYEINIKINHRHLDRNWSLKK